MKRPLTTLALIVLLIGLNACRESQTDTAGTTNKPVADFPAGVEKVEITITGMT